MGWGPVSYYKPDGGGVSFVDEYLGKKKKISINDSIGLPAFNI